MLFRLLSVDGAELLLSSINYQTRIVITTVRIRTNGVVPKVGVAAAAGYDFSQHDI